MNEKSRPASHEVVLQPPPAYEPPSQEEDPTGYSGPTQGYNIPHPQQGSTQHVPMPGEAGHSQTSQLNSMNASAATPGAQPQPSPYPPQAAPQALSAGAQYQQQLFAMCAAGQHEVQKKHGVAGIICAVICFPIGLLCLLVDVEKRCVRCGVRVE